MLSDSVASRLNCYNPAPISNPTLFLSLLKDAPHHMKKPVIALSRVLRCVVPVLLLLAFGQAWAQAPIEFYRATVPVKSQSAQERKAAAQKGFAEVIVRMSGSAQVLENAEILEAQTKALSYVDQFQYLTNDNEASVANGYREKISLAFSAPAVERLLRTNHQPFWPVNRPGVLVWLVEDSAEFGRQFVSAELAPEVVAGIESSASLRGLPLTYPLLDLQDQMNLNADQVWQLDEEAILVASQRYNADVILVGRYSTTSRGELLATWQFFHRDDTRVYDTRVAAAPELGAAALNPLADYLAGRYALVARGDERPALVMQLSGIDSYPKYRSALNYLDGMAATADVVLSAARQDTLLIYLGSETSVDKFVSVLALDGRMISQQQPSATDIPVWQQQPAGTVENPLRYRWK